MLAGSLQALTGGWPGFGADNGADHSAFEGAPPIDLEVLANAAWLLQLFAAGLFFAMLRRQLLPSATGSGPEPGAGSALWRIAALSAVFGLSWQVGGTWWLHIGMHKYAGLSALLSAAAVVALGAYLSVYTVLASVWFGWLCRHLARGSVAQPLRQAVGTAAAFAGAWLLAELGRAMVMTGFPWAASGYAHLQGPLRALAPWLGVYGAGAVAAFVAALVVELLRRSPWGWRPRAAVAAGVAAIGGLLAWLPDASFTRSSGEFEVVLLQGNVSQEGKFDPARMGQALGWHQRELTRSFADLTLTPETALAVLEQELPPAFWQPLQRRVASHPGVLLIGVPQRVGAHGQRNGLLGLGHPETLVDPLPEGVYRYHKAHLVPFAEFTPLGFAWFTRLLDLPLPTFVPGAAAPQPLRIRTRSGPVQTMAPLICFEDLYGEELALRFRAPEAAPTAFANASNMAWFDGASALPQHLRIAQYRSLEFQRPTVRATNTGPTVVIDHQGRVTRALAPRTQGVLSAVVEGRSGLTPYAWWVSRLGLWPLVALAVLGLLLPWLMSMPPRPKAAPGRQTP